MTLAALSPHLLAIARAMLLSLGFAGVLVIGLGLVADLSDAPHHAPLLGPAFGATCASWLLALPFLVFAARRAAHEQQGARTFLGQIAAGRGLLALPRLWAGLLAVAHALVFGVAALTSAAAPSLLLLFGAAALAASALAAWTTGHHAAAGSLSLSRGLGGEQVPDLRSRLPLELAWWAALSLAPILPVTTLLLEQSGAPIGPRLLPLGLLSPLVAWLTYRYAEHLERDLERARARVARMQDSSRDERRGQARDVVTREGHALLHAIAQLVDDYEDLCAEELRARAAVTEAQRLKTRFMAYMSHDLRSPLNAILGFTDMLVGSPQSLNADQRESLDTVRDAAADLLRLVSEIVDSARLEAGKLKLTSAHVPVATLLSTVVGRARRNVEALGCQLETRVEPGVPTLYVDRDRMQQALLGLLLHVAHTVPSGTRIELRAARASGPPGPRGQVRVFVDAPGMSAPRDPSQLFEAFRWQRHESGMRIGGLGLGLSLARALVEAQGGAIWFDPPSTISVALPRQGH